MNFLEFWISLLQNSKSLDPKMDFIQPFAILTFGEIERLFLNIIARGFSKELVVIDASCENLANFNCM